MTPTFTRIITFIACIVLSGTLMAANSPDEGLPPYEKSSGISGNLTSVGSDTLANLMTLWAEEFRRVYPNVSIQVQAAGSSTAPPALTEGTANLGPMSRLMKDREIEAFETRHGYKPTPIAVALDALVLFVHKDNPIEGLYMQQVDSIFSSTRTCGGAHEIVTWGQLGLSGSWAARDFQIYGRNSVSGTYGYFKQHALCKGDFRNTVNEQPGSASVIQSVSTSLNGIGYSGIGYTTSSVRPLPLAATQGAPFVEATTANAVNGSYPLARFLYIYVNREPGKELDPLTTQFLTLILSKQGQDIVARDGYVSLPGSIAARQLSELQAQP